MHRAHFDKLMMANDEQIMTRRRLDRELRPTREDMLRFYRGEFVQPAVDTVCKGNCIYCDATA